MVTPALILVRHGRPQIDPDIPPPHWNLSSEGRAAIVALSGALAPFAPQAVISSPEPKALQTAELIAGHIGFDIEIDTGLGEHRRPSFPFGPDAEFLVRMAAVFRQPYTSAPCDESADQALHRLTATLARYPVRPLVAVTHGTVLSLYLARRLGLDAHGLWRSLKTPEAFVLDADGGLIARLS